MITNVALDARTGGPVAENMSALREALVRVHGHEVASLVSEGHCPCVVTYHRGHEYSDPIVHHANPVRCLVPLEPTPDGWGYCWQCECKWRIAGV